MPWWWELQPLTDGDKARLKRIERKVDKIMGDVASLTAILTEISAEVDKVSADTDSLLEKLSQPNPDVTAAIALATGIRDRMKALDDKVPDPTPPAG